MNVGDEVICVDAIYKLLPGWVDPGLKRGETYHIRHSGERCCSVTELRIHISGVRPCTACGDYDGYWHWDKWRFVRLPKLTVDQEDEVTA